MSIFTVIVFLIEFKYDYFDLNAGFAEVYPRDFFEFSS